MLGLLSSALILRGSDLTRLMVTLGVASILYELANRLDHWTGGADGLQGVVMGPLLGIDFDLQGRVAAAYSLCALLLALWLCRRLVHSPFGVSLQALRDNRLRASAIGLPVNRLLVAVYTLGAALAGTAGALLAQTTGFASLDVLDFHRSADVLLVLVIGGTGYLWGGVIGAIGFKLMQDLLSSWTPQYWTFWIGLFLVVLVLVGGTGCSVLGCGCDEARGHSLARMREREQDGAVLTTTNLSKRFGGLKATDDVTLTIEQGARHALIGPNGAGKTTLVNLLTGVLEPTAGRIHLDDHDITSLAPHKRVQRGLVRTFQINQLFATLTPLAALSIAVARTLGRSARSWRALDRDIEVAAECERLLAQFKLDDVKHRRTAELPYGKRRLLEIALAIACKPRVLLLDEPAAGVPAGERHEIFDSLARLPQDVSVLLIEHDMDLVFNFASRVTVLVDGAIYADGDVRAIAADERVKAVYLGQAADHA